MALWDKVKKALIGDAPAPEAKPAPKAPAAAPAATEPDGDIGDYKACVVEKGPRGWGGPLTIQPTTKRKYIYSVTGGGIHPVAQKIADITGATPFDGFSSKANFDELAVAVIDCGGTARVGVYPMKGVLTIDIHAATPSGPLMKYIEETNFVSAVGLDQVREA
jgi:PTS system glucitol/sorbitol-specific IIB component